MPNYVKNVLTVDKDSVTKERFMQIAEFVASKERLFDFNQIIPQSPELYVQHDDENRTARMEQNRVSYGFVDWYNWRRTYWGTKGNAFDISSPCEGFGWEFLTMFASPIPVFSVLSLVFPEVVFTLKYADEDFGNNCGEVVLLGGKVVHETYFKFEEGREFSENLWGHSLEKLMYKLDCCQLR